MGPRGERNPILPHGMTYLGVGNLLEIESIANHWPIPVAWDKGTPKNLNSQEWQLGQTLVGQRVVGSRSLTHAGSTKGQKALSSVACGWDRSNESRISLVFDSTEHEVLGWIKFWSHSLVICHSLLWGREVLEMYIIPRYHSGLSPAGWLGNKRPGEHRGGPRVWSHCCVCFPHCWCTWETASSWNRCPRRYDLESQGRLRDRTSHRRQS